MKRLIALEWLKFSRHRGIRVGLLMYVLIFPGAYYASRMIAQVSNNPMINLQATTEFPRIWELNSYIGNWLAFLILGFLAIQLISIEFENKTFRQNVITGFDRRAYWLSKILSAALLSLAATLVYIVYTILFGMIYSPDSSLLFEANVGLQVLYFFTMSFGYCILAMFIAFLTRKGSAAMFIYFLYGMFLENIIRWWAHQKILPNISMHFYPMNVLEDLTPMPFFAQMVKMGNVEFELTLEPSIAFIGALAYTGLFIFVMYRLATRKDL